jgi:hypothetical protein
MTIIIRPKSVLIATLEVLVEPYLTLLSGRHPKLTAEEKVRANKALDIYTRAYDCVKERSH